MNLNINKNEPVMVTGATGFLALLSFSNIHLQYQNGTILNRSN